MDLEQALQTFLDESGELLDEMERILLDIEADTATPEQLGALFRAMHTIKGSAGLFGLDEIVSFSHQAENLLDKLRDGEFKLDNDLVGVLLRCHDHVKAMLAALAAKESLADFHDPDLERALQAYAAPPAPSRQESLPVELERPPTEPANQHWVLSLRFGPDVLRNGLDPSSFIRYLATIGLIEQIETICVNLPAGDDFNAESNYLRLEVLYRAELSERTLFEVFEFAREDSEIFIWPLKAAAAHLLEACASATPPEAAAVTAAWRRFGALPERPADAEPEHGHDEEDVPSLSLQADKPLIAAPEPEASHPPSAAQAPADARGGKHAESKFIKVEASKLDSLINLIGELVIAGAAANLAARRSQQTALVEATLPIANLIEQIRAGTLSMRMVQIGEIFNRFPRVVRDVAKELDKPIQLHISGAETELDKSMVEKLGDPLMHIVRNAMDHGIEPAALRAERGKPAEGNVWLNAYHESGSVVIEVADDGGGLSRERILAKARERGLVSPEQTLSDKEIYPLIFEPGFSTSDHVTNLSGRGVGMDVARRGIEQLHGAIDIETEPGRGTAFRIRLPLTLAIIDGFLVEVGQSTFVLPLEAVVECMELPVQAQGDGAHACINLRGELLPLLWLGDFLELPARPGRRSNIVVAQYGERKAGLVVDALLGEFQTVIKPLGALFSRLRAVSGSTILGTGEVALILDVPALIRHATEQETQRLALLHQQTGRGRAIGRPLETRQPSAGGERGESI